MRSVTPALQEKLESGVATLCRCWIVTRRDGIVQGFASTFFFDTYMRGVTYIRVWNTSKTPAQPAWVKAQPAADTLQVGDPTDVTPNRVMALDISPMMQNLFGAVFRQRGIMVKGGIIAATTLDNIGISGNGVTGSFVTAGQCFVTGAFNSSVGVAVVPCTELSPVSNSNLVFVRETVTTTATNRLLTATALFV